MFKGSQKSKIVVSPDKKIEDKVSQDFITHNMPESHRFSGQTFSGPSVSTSKPTAISNVDSHHKIGLLIIGGGLVLIVALFYFGYSLFIKPYVKTNPVANTDKTKNIEVIATSSKEEEPAKIVETIATSAPIISTSTNLISTTSSSTDVIMPEDKPVITTSVVVSTIDSDADGLTDDEEKIIGTDPNKADTDGDGYLDLAELKSGYDPLVPGKKVSTSSAMLGYQIDPKTTIIYPATWDVTKSDSNNTVVFTDSDKAFIQVVYQNNTEKLSPSSWFTEQFTGLTPGESVSGNSWQGFYSKDGLSAYIFNKGNSKIYSFSCSPLTPDTTSVTLFHLMIKTLLIK